MTDHSDTDHSDTDHADTPADEHVTRPWAAADAIEWLRPPGANDHKMTRGVLAARIGSAKYPGAAVLGVTAAWRTGLGMVRYLPPLGDAPPAFGLPTPAAAVLAARPETLFGDGVCDAWLIGSGTDAAVQSTDEAAAIDRLHTGDAPIVLDAGALESALTRNPVSAPAVLTPHLGEFRRLWAAADLGPLATESQSGSGSESIPTAAIARLASHLEATILLKGSTSVIATPGGRLLAVGPATPWLATAGTGDVLAGILGALVARHAREVRADAELLAPLAATAALVHDTAARIASQDDSPHPQACTGAPVTALDVAHAVPLAIRHVQLHQPIERRSSLT